MEKARISQPS